MIGIREEANMLEAFGEEIWIADGPSVTSAGFRYPTRMAVIRLGDGSLFVWSPTALTDALRGEVERLGRVRFIVTPTAMHATFLPDWRRAFPGATLFAAPGSRDRSRAVAFDADLGDAPDAGWAGEIDQAPMRGNLIATEVVFFHRRSRTVLIADLIQHFPPGWFKGLQALVARLDGMTGPEPRVPQKFRMAFTDRRAARTGLAHILGWPVERVVMAHAEPVRSAGRAFIARAFSWLR
jgi:hypothetical protein